MCVGNNVRGGADDEEEHDVYRVEQHIHRLVPPEYDEHSVHPVRDLCDAGHSAALRLDVERVRVLAETSSEIERLSFGENNKCCGEVEVILGRSE